MVIGEGFASSMQSRTENAEARADSRDSVITTSFRWSWINEQRNVAVSDVTEKKMCLIL